MVSAATGAPAVDVCTTSIVYCIYCIVLCITPTHTGEHEVMRIQTIIMRTRTHSMQAMANLLRGPHIPQARPTRPTHATQVGARIPITTPPPWITTPPPLGEQLRHGGTPTAGHPCTQAQRCPIHLVVSRAQPPHTNACFTPQ
jgi:hypothetical protein